MNWLCKSCWVANRSQLCWTCGANYSDSFSFDLASPLASPTVDPQFGELFWDSTYDWWIGSYPPEDARPFVLYVKVPSPDDRSISEAARSIFARVRNDLDSIRRDAAVDFLPELNGNGWANPPMTLEDFLLVLVPSEISVEPDGYAEVVFADGTENDSLLGGHFVVSRFYPDGLREVVLEG